ncbi:hypothetical protein GCM10017600_60660 [Streptosporangium carneum]|uniref:Uncharacterized protein n=1 Tax=Streptosporangium carneum TaxID=47481 RepID=A0A9W6MFV1_9ACTN|nr:hypothetical protein GCM10017600_60660 [Streptosporangium carneum]
MTKWCAGERMPASEHLRCRLVDDPPQESRPGFACAQVPDSDHAVVLVRDHYEAAVQRGDGEDADVAGARQEPVEAERTQAPYPYLRTVVR